MTETDKKADPCCDAGGIDASRCPSCGTKGRAVKPITIESLVIDEARRRSGRTDGFRFCPEPSCDLAYFHPETGAQVVKGDVRVRIGQKETHAPRPVCYCFGHTAEEIEAEVLASGSSRIADDITEKCRQGMDRCEETNPQGACCLGNVRQVAKEALARTKNEAASTTTADPSCCAVTEATGRSGTRRSSGMWATTGAVVSAVLSSACCWLPLLLIAFGASAAGVAGFFEAYRPHLLGATALFLASGFYLVYFRKENCGPGEACAVPAPRLRRMNKIMLWVASAVVLSFAFFPNYVGYLLGSGHPNAPAAATNSGERRAFRIEGMTCEACAVTLRERLGQVPGVVQAEVSFEEKIAHVFVAAGPAPSENALLAAIGDAGYSGVPVAAARTVHIAISGMTCAGCASGLQLQLHGLPGVESADVDYDSANATVAITTAAALDSVLEAIKAHGFTGTIE